MNDQQLRQFAHHVAVELCASEDFIKLVKQQIKEERKRK